MEYAAFRELSTCRATGMSVGPIPWTAIRTYGRDAGLAGEEMFEFVFLIREMDEAYLRFHREREEKMREEMKSARSGKDTRATRE